LWFLANGSRHNEDIQMKFWPVGLCVNLGSALAHQIWPSSVKRSGYITQFGLGRDRQTGQTTDRYHRANRFTNGRPKTVRLCYRTAVCLSCLSVCLSVCNVAVLWSNGWMDQDGTWHGVMPQPRRHCVRRGTQPPPQKGYSPQFSVHVYCGQTAAWIKMPLGTEVGLGSDDIVLGGDPAPTPHKGGRAPQFSAHFYCGKRMDASRCHLVWR